MKPMMAITTSTMKTPTQTPASKIVPIASQAETDTVSCDDERQSQKWPLEVEPTRNIISSRRDAGRQVQPTPLPTVAAAGLLSADLSVEAPQPHAWRAHRIGVKCSRCAFQGKNESLVGVRCLFLTLRARRHLLWYAL